MLYLDLETKSQCDLTFQGLRRYAEDTTTEVTCMAYAFDDEAVRFWWSHEPFPEEVIEHFDAGGLIMAHNAEFERHMFDFVIAGDYDFDPPALTQWRCSMALALVSGYPAGLGRLAKALSLPSQKQSHGTRLIREYCGPNHLTEFKPGDKELMQTYCEYDVLVMREAAKHLRPLSDDEWAEYHLNQKINDRGIPVDVDFCTAALSYSGAIAEDADAEIAELTGGLMIKHTQRKSRDAWLFPRLTEGQMKLLEVYKKGEKKISLDQDHRGYLLADQDLNHEARQLLEAMNGAGSSALKKYGVATHNHVAGRVHNTFLWHGAQTGRFSGKGLQPHNFRRDAYGANEAESLIQDIIEGYGIDKPSTTMARLLRSMIKSDKGIYYVDWSAIEGRVAPWLSRCDAGERKLDIYRAERDVYVVTAADMFHLDEADVDKNFRQSGKIAELSLQFGGSHNALIGMAKNYGVTFDEDTARDIVTRWRRANPWAVEIWADYDKAICAAVKSPGTPFDVGRVTYQSDGHSFLWCRLPSGGLLSYPQPRWEPYTTPWGEERVGPTFQISMQPAAGEDAMRNHLRGALLFQNSVQAVAAVLLREALVAADAEGLQIIGSVHDEIVGEGPICDGHKLNEIMLRQPEWAEGLPLATGGVEWGKRYGK
jgi:DNA polymerase bacteriophage-type